MGYRENKTSLGPSGFPTGRSGASLLLQFFFVRVWFRVWRFCCPYLFLISISFNVSKKKKKNKKKKKQKKNKQTNKTKQKTNKLLLHKPITILEINHFHGIYLYKSLATILWMLMFSIRFLKENFSLQISPSINAYKKTDFISPEVGLSLRITFFCMFFASKGNLLDFYTDQAYTLYLINVKCVL